MAYNSNIATQIAASSALVSKALSAVVRTVPGSLDQFGNEFINQMKSTLNHAGSGIQYPGNPKRSSAPGEAPAPQTREYVESWDYAIGQLDAHTWFVDVGSPKEYGPYLEYGTSIMEPRPHLRPMVDRMKGQLAVRIAGQAKESELGEITKRSQDLIELLIGGGE